MERENIMILVLDIGNTNTVIGVFSNKLEHNWRIRTDRHKTSDEFAILIKALFDQGDMSFSKIEGIIISSVVPPIMMTLEKMCRDYFGISPIIVDVDKTAGHLKIAYPYPEELGADRIVNAVAAIDQYGEGPFVIIDFGTATTYCYINESNEYVGGIISPGIKISMDALYHHASKLPKIEITQPKQVIGSSTIEAMQSGVFYGYLEQVDGMITRIEKELKVNAKVIATGGLAELIAEKSDKIDEVDPYLTLNGLYVIFHKLNYCKTSVE